MHRNENGTIVHAVLDLGHSVVILGQYSETGWLRGGTPHPLASTVSIYVAVEDPDAQHAGAVAAGARSARPAPTSPYGSREYSARDQEGDLWSFGTYNPTVIG